ncbi:hypothetical protein MAE02_23540 [Microvirga aerophila]|uniref:UPF0391 membrane protein MAE02_23540 n=2 Tax=Microvirga aerophila TaxID=670291 RepID=A0A512BRN7_9HYPH|nr:hypothetical protein MAE02_23540 [Microvirga aerophila]
MSLFRGTLQSRLAFIEYHRPSVDLVNVRGNTMLGWAVTFLIIALVAALFGFGGIAGTAVEIAKLIFFVAIVLFAISAVIGLMRGRAPRI